MINQKVELINIPRNKKKIILGSLLIGGCLITQGTNLFIYPIYIKFIKQNPFNWDQFRNKKIVKSLIKFKFSLLNKIYNTEYIYLNSRNTNYN